MVSCPQIFPQPTVENFGSVCEEQSSEPGAVATGYASIRTTRSLPLPVLILVELETRLFFLATFIPLCHHLIRPAKHWSRPRTVGLAD